MAAHRAADGALALPAIEGERDKVIGILLAKDLLRYYAEESFDVRDMLRPAIFIPNPSA
jgi:magnesium and cobalt transporter